MALLAAQHVLIFIAEPLALKDFAYPLIATGLITSALVLVLVLGSHQRGARIVLVISGVRLLAGVVDLLCRTSLTAGAEAISAVLALLALILVVFGIVFGRGQITSHRVHGAVVLYLTITILSARLYLLIAEIPPGAFSGLAFHPAPGELSPFLDCSLTSLTTVGFGDITLLDAFARSLTTLEAVVGQLFRVEELALAAPEVVARRTGTRQIPEPTMISKS